MIKKMYIESLVGICFFISTGSGCKNINRNGQGVDSEIEIDSIIKEEPKKDSTIIKLAKVMGDYDVFYNCGEIIVVVNRNDFKEGVIDKEGRLIVPRIYDRISSPKDGLFIAEINKGVSATGIEKSYTLFNTKGDVIIPCDEYDVISEPSEGFVLVWNGDKCGYVNSKGKLSIPCIYDEGKSFSEGLAAVKKDGYWHYIDKTGKTIISLSYDEVGDFHEGLAKVGKDDKSGVIDKTGKEIILCSNDTIYGDCSEGLFTFFANESSGYINKEGRICIPDRYYSTGNFSNGLAFVNDKFNGKFGYIDKNGNDVISKEYNLASNFVDGVALVKKGVYWGLIDNKGNSLTEFEYEEVGVVSDGMINVKKDLWGYINTDGKQVTPFVYERADGFIGGIALILKEGKWGFINREGESTFDYQNLNGAKKYEKYIGKWTQYIYSNGIAYRCLSAIIYSDYSCEFISYTPEGERNSIHFNKCVFKDGLVYFTDYGDITFKGTPRFRLGPNGLQMVDGEEMVKE